MAVLYRKYRPQKFVDVVGQNHIKITLGNEIAQGNLAHAYLFVGPRGTGKTTLARLFARSINCLKHKPGVHEPCNTCESCTRILADKSLDIVEVDAATHTQVDNVRDNIISSARIPPIASNGYKVFIIDEIHMLSKHAFNALLKTIEEPPPRVIFILATTDIYRVPDTIISRCQRFDFKKIPQHLIVNRLKEICAKEQVMIPDDILMGIARKSEGCLRDAESLLGQMVAMAEKGKVKSENASLILPKPNWAHIASLTDLLHKRNLKASLELIFELVHEGMDPETFIADLIEYLRQVLLKRSIGTSFQPDFDEQTVASINQAASDFSMSQLKQLIEIFMREAYRTKNTIIPQLPLELGCIEFCQEAYEGHEQERKPVAGTSTPAMNATVVLLKKEWATILSELKGHNHSLSVFLKMAHPLTLVGSTLTIGFKYDFHADTVRENKNKKAAEEIVSRVLKQPISIDCVVDYNYTENHKNFIGGDEPEVQDVLAIMGGGEVI